MPRISSANPAYCTAINVNLDQPVVYRYLLEKHAVGLVPGEAFGLPGFVRISYAASMENLQKAMDRLRAGLSSLQACREQQQHVRV